MTGMEHYQEAERLLKASTELTQPVAEHDFRALQERALVHAVLAVAACGLAAVLEDNPPKYDAKAAVTRFVRGD